MTPSLFTNTTALKTDETEVIIPNEDEFTELMSNNEEMKETKRIIPKLYKNQLQEIFSFFSANEIYCKVRSLSKTQFNLEETLDLKWRETSLKIFPPSEFEIIPTNLDKLLTFTNKICIVIMPDKGDRKLSLDILSAISKPYL